MVREMRALPQQAIVKQPPEEIGRAGWLLIGATTMAAGAFLHAIAGFVEIIVRLGAHVRRHRLVAHMNRPFAGQRRCSYG
ncbi:hypothetical protein [Streptomyces lutosisoli]|uniref:Uncharacterized protein n=1 Tax=Streptomyces lutosisoli TaxID=2665721 RepID=A0ABW2VSP2_9ACTN